MNLDLFTDSTPHPQNTRQSIESAIRTFVESLPHWSKFLAARLLTNKFVTEEEIELAYGFFREHAGLKPITATSEPISIATPVFSDRAYKSDVQFVGLANVTGVNALVENQVIEFSPSLTIIYGANASGKTGYVRLLKQAFNSRSKGDILHNIYTGVVKNVSAKFTFTSGGNELLLNYPADSNSPEFNQFSVFDSQSVAIHLTHENKFEFQPAALSFFTELTDALRKVENKLSTDIAAKQEKDFSVYFQGESEIRKSIKAINISTDINKLRKVLPYTEADKESKTELDRKRAQLLLLSKEKEINTLRQIEGAFEGIGAIVEGLNKLIRSERINDTITLLQNYSAKISVANSVSLDAFKGRGLVGVGSDEWKTFIKTGYELSSKQHPGAHYPIEGDICLFCQQQLTEEAIVLIEKYWAFISSKAESEASALQVQIEQSLKEYSELSFDLFDEDSIATKWLAENQKDIYDSLTSQLALQKQVAEKIVNCLRDGNPSPLNVYQKPPLESSDEFKMDELQVDISYFNRIRAVLSAKIVALQVIDSENNIASIDAQLVQLSHKALLAEHIDSIEKYIDEIKLLKSEQDAKQHIQTRPFTEKAKQLSTEYITGAYEAEFKAQCSILKSKVKVDLKQRGETGSPYRTLDISGRVPSDILSEGEQKVIALADFLTEVSFSPYNRGVIFDDPVNSLDEERKGDIAKRLVQESKIRQVVVFTHDLVFVSALYNSCSDESVEPECHWIENDGGPGRVSLKNSPAFEDKYKSAQEARRLHSEATSQTPQNREAFLKNGYAALRTSYEYLVVFILFKKVVMRFNERISVDRLKDVVVEDKTKEAIIDGYSNCCRHMEGHLHSDKYAFEKPTVENLLEEIERYEEVKKLIKK